MTLYTVAIYISSWRCCNFGWNRNKQIRLLLFSTASSSGNSFFLNYKITKVWDISYIQIWRPFHTKLVIAIQWIYAAAMSLSFALPNSEVRNIIFTIYFDSVLNIIFRGNGFWMKQLEQSLELMRNLWRITREFTLIF